MRAWSKEEEALYCQGVAFHEKGDLRGAGRCFRALATRGDATAQHALAHVLTDKKPPRYAEATRWYKRAIRNGNRASAWNLALDYGQRRMWRWQKYWLQVYVRMDRKNALEDAADWADTLIERKQYRAALSFLELAAGHGDARAQNDLAILLETKIKPARVREALSWYRKAAKKGSKEAAHNLSLHYRDNGDLVRRLQWLRIAEKTGHSEAKSELRQLERPRHRG
jgi:TPR repeat protein